MLGPINKPLTDVEWSTRGEFVIQRSLLYDLKGLSDMGLKAFAQVRNCGAKTVVEAAANLYYHCWNFTEPDWAFLRSVFIKTVVRTGSGSEIYGPCNIGDIEEFKGLARAYFDGIGRGKERVFIAQLKSEQHSLFSSGESK